VPVRIDDVARAANVSTGTVSRVMNSPQIVSSETRKRVEAAMKRLAYKPNTHARALALRAKSKGQ
jgi:LacI family transcriptional regulator